MNYSNDKAQIDELVSNIKVYNKINIFDFDGTIFNSPVPNPNLLDSKTFGKLMAEPSRGGLGWFQHNITLGDKYIQDSTFNKDIVNEVRKSMNDPSAVTVMLTGRDTTFKNQIKNILAREGLVFDEYGFKPYPVNGESRLTTMNFKKEYIKELIRKYEVYSVEMWEDRAKHVTTFDEFLTNLGVNAGVNHVDTKGYHMHPELELEIVSQLRALSPSYAPYPRTESVESKRSPTYWGVFLYNDSHDLLLNEMSSHIPNGWKTYAHHMTMLFNKNKNDNVMQYIKSHIGMSVDLMAVAVGISNEAIAVKIKSDVPVDNNIPHITIATPPNGKPFNSNKITNWKPLDTPIKLSGLIDAFYP